ncbi:hypothetical protein SODALDRAFT_277296 [Sodiomyces alkalinus F11]|uniref:Mitochondrial K+-H+ exchange-related-domain-containing protein n=1 Tax=Sodiomyces alkalinus (strain CBS 110278 / VKM F-3762 / F11) TaxID=1314773 RepID=A0A3N2PW00_SODAK|nr:hypothetical protein SODALDRAFT_277296 [Sodiomyces alkalinus F11]ROT38671.1 hypothetical protein SODALDRAFT_277296 [Sodiomyces alkalinus F11]
MRLFLLPLTTSRTLLYCQRVNVATAKLSLADKATNRAAKLWAGWESHEKGWQKTVVNYGNYLLRRIPYQEWGLKSIPPLSARRKYQELQGDKVEVVFPGSIMPPDSVDSVLAKLATERTALHKNRLVWCFVGMPITIPFILVPVIPNFPFFYLAYRAWSHWRAIAGGAHIEFLRKNKLINLAPSSLLDSIYSPLTSTLDKQQKETLSAAQSSEEEASGSPDVGEKVLLSHNDGTRIAETLDLPELKIEMERAIWQVNHDPNGTSQDNSRRSEPASTTDTTSQMSKDDGKK